MFPLVLAVAATVSLVVNVFAGQVYVIGFVTFLGRLVLFLAPLGSFFWVLWGFLVSRRGF